MLSTPTPKYGVLITTVDPTQNIIEGVLKTGGVAHIAMFNKPAAFRWPNVGEAWMARQENGTWILDGLMVTTNDPDTFVAEPGDLVLNSATGRIVVTGGTEVVSIGGDIGGTGIDPEVTDLHLTPTALTNLAGDLAGTLLGVLAPPYGHAIASPGQVVGTGTAPTVTCASDTIAHGMTFATNQFTVPIAGRYMVSAYVIWQTSGGGASVGAYTQIGVVKNGSLLTTGPTAPYNTTYTTVTVTDETTCAAGDTLKITMFNNTGITLTINNGVFLARYMGAV